MKPIVIGGGLAGIAAALHLHDHGVPTTVLERNHFLGGRSGSVYDKRSQQELDLAQHVFLFCCHRYRALLHRLGTDVQSPVISPLNVPVIDGDNFPTPRSVARLYSKRLPVKLHMAPAFLRYHHVTPRERFITARALLKIARINRYEQRYAEQTFADWLRAEGVSPNAMKAFWSIFVTAVFNASLHKVSAQWGFMFFQEAILKERRGPEIGFATVPSSRLLQPADTILRKSGGQIVKKAKVQNIVIQNNAVAGIRFADGTFQPAKHIIVAVGHRDMPNLLPESVRNTPFFRDIKFLPTNPIIDVHLGFRQRVTPPAFRFAVFMNSPVQWVFSHDNGKRLAVSISNPGPLLQYNATQLETIIGDEIQRLFSCNAPEWIVVRRFRHATFSVAPGMEKYRRPQKTPVRGLYVAGDWTETGWPATMEGAVLSGERAAKAVLHAVANDAHSVKRNYNTTTHNKHTSLKQ